MHAPLAAPPPIAAIATPAGRGGIGIVRVSGRDIRTLIEAVAGRALEPRVASRVDFLDAAGATIDSGIAIYFPQPNSYTGEDVVEWHGHGGAAVMRLLLARCVELGARLAEPGEFTKRAFLNGKLDLVQAEAVADVIEAATATAVRAAARSLSGEFSRDVHALRDALIDLRAYTEATLDFPEEDLDLLREGDVRERLATIRQRLERMLARGRAGAVLREGLTVVLVGAPNVGKSSLLNRLVGEDAAIVTAIPGTTRDTVERNVEVAGIPLTIVDTAGLRETTDTVELLGIERTRSAIARADLALIIVDAREDDRVRGSAIGEVPSTLPRIIVHNKCDLARIAPHVVGQPNSGDAAGGGAAVDVWLCALNGDGVDALVEVVQRVAGIHNVGEDALFARARQLEALRDASTHLQRAEIHADSMAPIELFAEELRAAQHALSSITGEFSSDDLLGEIFSRFCIGK